MPEPMSTGAVADPVVPEGDAGPGRTARWESLIILAAGVAVLMALFAIFGVWTGLSITATGLAIVTLAWALGYEAVDRRLGGRPLRLIVAFAATGIAVIVALHAVAWAWIQVLPDARPADDLVSRCVFILTLASLAVAVASRDQRDMLTRTRPRLRESAARVLAAGLAASAVMLVWWYAVDRPDQPGSPPAPSAGLLVVGAVAFVLAFVALTRWGSPTQQGEQVVALPQASSAGAMTVPTGTADPSVAPPLEIAQPVGTAAGAETPWTHRAGRALSNWAGALLATVGLLPGLLAGSTVLFMLLDLYATADPAAGWSQKPVEIVVYGCIGSVATWLVLGAVTMGFTGVRRANPAMYRELVARTQALMGGAGPADEDVDPQRARSFVRATQAGVAQQLGLSVNGVASEASVGIAWTTGSGYIGLWQQIHRAEEAQFLFASDGWVFAAGASDRNRLLGSNVAIADELRGQALRALTVLDASATKVLEPTSAAVDVVGMDDADARGVLRSVRLAINEFKDDSSLELVRLRRTGTQTLLWTGLVGYLVLALLVMAQVSPVLIVTGAGVLAVAVIAGLAQKINSDLSTEASPGTGEDFGLNGVRLLLTSLVSGLAGISGVVLLAILAGPPFDLPLLRATQNDLGVTIDDAFQLALNPVVLAAAAAFGLAPGVLISGLNTFGQNVSSNLASIAPANPAK